jgi:hypothetical protein
MRFRKALLIVILALLGGTAVHAYQASGDSRNRPTQGASEPSSIMLLAGGVVSLWFARRRARSKGPKS